MVAQGSKAIMAFAPCGQSKSLIYLLLVSCGRGRGPFVLRFTVWLHTQYCALSLFLTLALSFVLYLKRNTEVNLPTAKSNSDRRNTTLYKTAIYKFCKLTMYQVLFTY